MDKFNKNMCGYILVGKIPVQELDLLKWRQWMEKEDRHVAKTYIGDKFVSTVFLGLDYDFFGNGLPILFETMVFKKDGPRTITDVLKMTAKEIEDNNEDRLDIQERYATWEQAEIGHKKICKMVELLEGIKK